MHFRKQMGFRLLAGCLSALMFLPQVAAQEAQTVSEPSTISRSEKAEVEIQESRDANVLPGNKIGETKQKSNKKKGNDGGVAQTTFLGTLNLVQLVTLFALLKESKGHDKRLDEMAKKLEENSKQKREDDSSRKSSLKKKNGAEEEEKEEEKEEEEEKSEMLEFWREKKRQVRPGDSDQNLSARLTMMGLEEREIGKILIMRSVMKGFLGSTESPASTWYIGNESLKDDMCRHGLFAIVNYICSDEGLCIPLYCTLLLLNDIGANTEDATGDECQLYDKLKGVMSNVVLEKNTTLQQCLIEICNFLRKKHKLIENNRYLAKDLETLEKWNFIADNITNGARKVEDSL